MSVGYVIRMDFFTHIFRLVSKVGGWVKIVVILFTQGWFSDLLK